MAVRAFFIICLVGWVTMMAPAQADPEAKSEQTIAEGLVLVQAEFGLVEESADGTVQIKATDSIQFKEGQLYGWRLKMRGMKEAVTLREELELPVAPKQWGSAFTGNGFSVSSDGRTGITELEAEIKDGTLMNAWKLVPGDPTGNHVLRIFLQGKLIRTYKFQIVRGS